MATHATALIARKSIRSRLGRTIAIAVAVMAGVSFVVGSFVLADSLRATFSDLFDELAQDVDLEVRSAQEFDGDASREPIPVELADTVAAVDGVSVVEPGVTRFAQLLDDDGESIGTTNGPPLGVSWLGDDGLQGVTLKEGVVPSGPDQLAIDKAASDRENIDVGDTVSYVTDAGTYTGTVTATLGLADTDGFAGATVVALDLATALDHFGTGGMVDAIDVKVDDGADPAAVQADIQDVMPATVEVITGEEVADEASDDVNGFIDVFGTGLLIFAFITAFVSAFIINNVFQITIGQRLRELALLRAVGASGRQIRWMITIEALILGIVATVLGVFGGILVARLLVAAFGAAGAGFPSAGTVLLPRTIVMAALVGVGITMLSVLVPARHAARIPPVAAMRPELGFSAMRTTRLVAGITVTAIGGGLFLIGLFLNPGGGAAALALFAGLGALLLFLGVASISSTIARPVTRAIGWPIEKLFKTPGALARENVARAPRRTSSSAAALMIGVSLVSAAAVFASSLRATFVETLENAINADYIVTDETFQGLSPIVSETLADVPELDAVTPIRGIGAIVDGDEKSFGAIDADAFDQLVNADVEDGSIAGLQVDEVLVHTDPADDLDLEVGSTFDVVYQNGVEGSLTVAGIYGDATFGNWLIGLDTLESVSSAPPRDFFVIGKLAEGVSPDDGNAAVFAATEEFPQAKVQTNAEFRQEQEDQIDQLLLVITMLLAFAIAIAILGISITLALGVFERTREIGLLRAVGMNRRQTRRSVRWEAVIVSTFGAIVGIVLGTFLGVALSLAVPDEFVSKLAFSPSTTVTILVGAVIAGLLAAIYPARKAAKMDILEAIATE
jgi:putative ABC transport system permease protein